MPKHYDIPPVEGHDPQIGLLLAALNDSTREWRENLGTPTVEAMTWQSVPNGHSIGALLLHIIDCEAYWLETFVAGQSRPEGEEALLLCHETKQDDALWPVPPSKPLEWYFELHDKIRQRVFDAVRGIDPTKTYGEGEFSCTFRWVVAHLVEHDSYHGGQAVLLHEEWKKSQHHGQ